MGRDSISAKKAGKHARLTQGEGKAEGNSPIAAIDAATAELPEAIRAAILALVNAYQPAPDQPAKRRKGRRG